MSALKRLFPATKPEWNVVVAYVKGIWFHLFMVGWSLYMLVALRDFFWGSAIFGFVFSLWLWLFVSKIEEIRFEQWVAKRERTYEAMRENCCLN